MTFGNFSCSFDTRVHLFYMGLDKKELRKQIDIIDRELSDAASSHEPLPRILLNERSFLVTLLKSK